MLISVDEISHEIAADVHGQSYQQIIKLSIKLYSKFILPV